MPITLSITVGPNHFDAAGDFAFDDGLVTMFRAWLTAQAGDSAQDTVDALADRLRLATDAEAAAVAAATSTPTTGD